MIAGMLAAAGLGDAVARELAAEVALAADSVLDREDGEVASAAEVVLRAAVAGALQARRFADAIHVLLDWLEERLDALAPYDLGRFWHLRGLTAWRRDGLVFVATHAFNRSIVELSALSEPRARSYLARVHDTFGQMLHNQGMLSEARHELEIALAARAPDDHFGTALTCGNLGRLCMDLGDFAAADAYFTRDLAIVTKHQPEGRRFRAQLHSHLGECELRLGNIERAQQHYVASYELADAGYPAGIAFAMLGLGRVALRRGRADLALDIARAARAAKLDVPAKTRCTIDAFALKLSGDVRFAAGEHDAAIADYSAAISAIAVGEASPIERAEILRGVARAQRAKAEVTPAVDNLRLALTALDATTAQGMRRDIESELEAASNVAWIKYSAGRFIGQSQLEDVLRKAGYDGYQGELQHLTMLFSDIRGFTGLSELLTPTELVMLLNDFLAAMTRCIEHHGGAVDKFIGDAVMAVFPRDPSAPFDAIGAALAMREELQRINRFARKSNPKIHELSIGVGIHAGSVVSGLIGSPQRRSVTVIGDAVNTASRLEGMTKQLGASILVTDAVLTGDRSRYLLRPLGKFAPKGRAGAIAVYDVMGVRDRSPASQAMLREIGRVDAALRALTTREFRQAEAELTALAADTGGTPRAIGYRFLAGKAHELLEKPPAGDWAGAIALDAK